MTVSETRDAIARSMRINTEHRNKPWNPKGLPAITIYRSLWGIRSHEAGRLMEDAGEIEVISGAWGGSEMIWIAGPNFPRDRVGHQVMRIDESIRDIVTEQFLRDCAKLAVEQEVLDKRREDLWAQIADKVGALPDLATANKVFTEISYACATEAGQFRRPFFSVERACVGDYFTYGEGSKRDPASRQITNVNYGKPE